MTSLTSVPLQVYCSPRLGLGLLSLLKLSVSLPVVGRFPASATDFRYTSRLWLFNPKVVAFQSQLSTESHPLWWYIFPQGKTPDHMWCLEHLCMFFRKRENCLYFTTISFYKPYSGSVLMSDSYLHSDPLSILDFLGSAHTQFIYFTLSKNCGFVCPDSGRYLDTYYSLLDMARFSLILRDKK